ncbi:MAG: hypothetical protein EA338_00230 [Roseinatronobacter sp.]|nr:MAG: hypothetical protein EA338_00230 [Roseinatronobacter sp.]
MDDDLSRTGDAAHRHWIMIEPGQAGDVTKPHKQAEFALIQACMAPVARVLLGFWVCRFVHMCSNSEHDVGDKATSTLMSESCVRA